MTSHCRPRWIPGPWGAPRSPRGPRRGGSARVRRNPRSSRWRCPGGRLWCYKPRRVPDFAWIEWIAGFLFEHLGVQPFLSKMLWLNAWNMQPPSRHDHWHSSRAVQKKTKSKERRLAIHSGRGSTRSLNAGGYCQKIGSDTKLGLSMTRKNSSGKTQLDKSLSDVPFNVVGSHGAFPKPYMIPEVTSVRRISNGESHPRDPVRPQYPLVN